VVHTCNPSYSGDTDQEDRGLKPAWANSLPDPISKKTITKIGLVVWLKVKALCSNPRTTKKKKKKSISIHYVNVFCAPYFNMDTLTMLFMYYSILILCVNNYISNYM
jgi:hypothetical protein